MHPNKKLVCCLFAFVFISFSYSAHAEKGIPDWWSLNGAPKETTFTNIDESKVNIKDVSTAITILPTPVDEDNIRALITLFLDKDHGQVYYFLNAQRVTNNPINLIPNTNEAIPLTLPAPTIDPSPSIPANHLKNPKVLHASVAALDDIVVVTYGIQYDGPDNKKFLNLEYMYGQIRYPSVPCNQCDLKDVTIDWSENYHTFRDSDPLPHYGASCGSTNYAVIYSYWEPDELYPTLTAAITKAHQIVLSGTLYQAAYVKSGSIIKNENGEISDNLMSTAARRVSRLADFHKACSEDFPQCWCTTPTGARSSNIELLTNDSDHSARGIIVERKRSQGDKHNNLYWHGVRFNFADNNGNDLINDMTFAATEINGGVLVSKRTINYDKGIAPVIAFVEGARTYNDYDDTMIPLFEMHKASYSNKLYANIGGILASDGGDNKHYTFTIANSDKKHSMSKEYQDGKYDIDGFELKSIAAQEYDTFPSLATTPYGDILMARACGKNQAHICTQWAKANAPIEVNFPIHVSINTSPDSIQLHWEPSLSYGIDSYIIERDGVEIARVDGDTTDYIDQPLEISTSYNYSILAQNANGQQSERIYLGQTSTTRE